MKKILLIIIFGYAVADQSVYISGNQLQTAKVQAQADISTTKAVMPAGIESFDLSQDSVNTQQMIMKEAVTQAKGQSGQINTSYESGEKYYIFSDKLKQDSIKQSIEYQAHSPINANDTISYYNQLKENAKNSIGEGRLLIFISMSMPKSAIENLITQGEKVGAVFVLRGLVDGSLKKTQKSFYAAMNGHKVGAMINPELFKTFNVTKVPTFAIYANAKQNPLNTGCKIAPEFVTITGSVSVRYALEQMQQNSKLSGVAANLLELMDKSSFYKQK